MRASVTSVIIALGLALAAVPQTGRAQSDRDYIFTDLDGHLIVRFAGAGRTVLDEAQAYEILNAEFSTMVHDRLHADLQFADEPRDPDWASSMEPQIEQHVRQAGNGFSGVLVQCRAASCRIVLEQSGHWDVPQHRAVLASVQESLQAFIAARRHEFEPVFMITAYYQEYETPHIKAFLRRTTHAQPALAPGG